MVKRHYRGDKILGNYSFERIIRQTKHTTKTKLILKIQDKSNTDFKNYQVVDRDIYQKRKYKYLINRLKTSEKLNPKI